MLKTQSVINFGERIWKATAFFLPITILDFIGITVIKILFWYSDLFRKKFTIKPPPAPLRYRVWGDPDIKTFLSSGEHCFNDIKNALEKNNYKLSDFKEVYEFGCGCGRISTFLEKGLPNRVTFCASDIDQEAISWCNDNYGDQYEINRPMPPLRFKNENFDLIVAVAVFRHFTEDVFFKWLKELKRILRTNGILLISLHGKFCWKNFSFDEQSIISQQGYLFKLLKDPYQKNIFPPWYQAAYHSKEYAQKRLSEYFRVIDYIERGIECETDLVILQKRDIL